MEKTRVPGSRRGHSPTRASLGKPPLAYVFFPDLAYLLHEKQKKKKRHLHVSHKTTYLPPKILDNLCFSFLLGITARTNWKQCLCKILGGQIRCTMWGMQVAYKPSARPARPAPQRRDNRSMRSCNSWLRQKGQLFSLMTLLPGKSFRIKRFLGNCQPTPPLSQH